MNRELKTLKLFTLKDFTPLPPFYFDIGSSGNDIAVLTRIGVNFKSFYITSKDPLISPFPIEQSGSFCFADKIWSGDGLETDKISVIQDRYLSVFKEHHQERIATMQISSNPEFTHLIRNNFVLVSSKIDNLGINRGAEVREIDFERMIVKSSRHLPSSPFYRPNAVALTTDTLLVNNQLGVLFLFDGRDSCMRITPLPITDFKESAHGMFENVTVAGNKIFYSFSGMITKNKDDVIMQFGKRLPYKLFAVSGHSGLFVNKLSAWNPSNTPLLVSMKSFNLNDKSKVACLVDPKHLSWNFVGRVDVNHEYPQDQLRKSETYISPHFLSGQPCIFATDSSRGKLSVVDF